MAYTTSQVRTNLVTNPSFEVNTTGWTSVGTGTTIARTTSDAHVGSASCQVNKGAVANGRIAINSGSGGIYRFPVTAGQPYYASAYVKVPAGQPSCSLRIRTIEWQANGARNPDQVSATTVVTDSDGWVRLSFADTPTGGATPTVEMTMGLEEVTTNARTYLVDAFLFEQSSTLRPYFDGSTADTYTNYTLTAQAWTGTANASTSVTHWGLTSSYVNNGVARFNNSFRNTQAFREYAEVPNYAPRKVIYFASPFRATQGFFKGVVARTASASGVGTESAAGLRIVLRTATASGSGSSSVTTVLVARRTAIGSGAGSSVADGERVVPRSATASGQGSTGAGATGLHIAPRTATGLGVGSSTVTSFTIRAFTATGSGQGSESATGLRVVPRTATASGTGTSTSSKQVLRARTASATGVGSSTATTLRIAPRTASGAGSGQSTITSFAVRFRTATASGTGTQACVGVPVRFRTATASGAGTQSATQVKLLLFKTPNRTEIRAAERNDDSVAGRLFRYAEPTYAGVNVYKLVDGSFTEVEQREYDRIVKVYYGGSKNFVSAEEKTELVAAGYGEYIT